MTGSGIRSGKQDNPNHWRQGQVCPKCGTSQLDEVGVCGNCHYDAMEGTLPPEQHAERGELAPINPVSNNSTEADFCRACAGCPSKNPNLCPDGIEHKLPH